MMIWRIEYCIWYRIWRYWWLKMTLTLYRHSEQLPPANQETRWKTNCPFFIDSWRLLKTINGHIFLFPGVEGSLALEQLLRPADAFPCDGSSMQRRLPRRFDLLCSNFYWAAQGGSAACKVGQGGSRHVLLLAFFQVPSWWRLLSEGVRQPWGWGRGVLWVWVSSWAFQLQIWGPGVEEGDLQLPVQGHLGHHHLLAGGQSLGSPVLPVPLPTIGPLSWGSHPRSVDMHLCPTCSLPTAEGGEGGEAGEGAPHQLGASCHSHPCLSQCPSHPHHCGSGQKAQKDGKKTEREAKTCSWRNFQESLLDSSKKQLWSLLSESTPALHQRQRRILLSAPEQHRLLLFLRIAWNDLQTQSSTFLWFPSYESQPLSPKLKQLSQSSTLPQHPSPSSSCSRP